MKPKDELFIEFLLKEVLEAVYKRQIRGADIFVIYYIIDKWRKQNDGRETD